jgi:hypothetical protein
VDTDVFDLATFGGSHVSGETAYGSNSLSLDRAVEPGSLQIVLLDAGCDVTAQLASCVRVELEVDLRARVAQPKRRIDGTRGERVTEGRAFVAERRAETECNAAGGPPRRLAKEALN